MSKFISNLRRSYRLLQGVPKFLIQSLMVSLWFAILTFPIMVIQVNYTANTVEWQWGRLLLILFGGFAGSFIWFLALDRKDNKPSNTSGTYSVIKGRLLDYYASHKKLVMAIVFAIILLIPFASSSYFTRVLISAMIMMVLGVGLNIVVGFGGLLNLGYAAFYAVGAYTYGLLNYHFGIGFWIALPISAFTSVIAGLLVALPVIRLRGDYLAIITLAFGEITRIVLENWGEFTFGPSGIKGIDKPGLFGIDLSPRGEIIYVYIVVFLVLLLTILISRRMENSRIGRTWESLRENEIAARSMGINVPRTKLLIFAVGACIAGVAGALFATNISYINPKSFALLESIKILCVVVLGGMGSIPGVIVGSIVLQVIPEWLRPLQDYRLLVFGALLVVMMIFKPNGLFPKVRKSYVFTKEESEQ